MWNLSLGKKMAASLGAMVLFTLVLTVVSLLSQRSMKDSFDMAAGRTARTIVLSGTIDDTQSDMLGVQRGMMLNAFAKNAGATELDRQAYGAKVELLRKAIAELRPLLTSPETRQALSRIGEAAASWQSHFQTLARLCGEGKPEEAWAYGVPNTVPLSEAISRDVAFLSQTLVGQLDTEEQALDDLYSRTRAVCIGILVLALAVFAGISGFVRNVVRSLRKMAEELSQGAGQVAGASGQLSAASQSLAQGASEQAASLEETSASSEEVASMTHRNAENAQSAAELMTQVAQFVGDANQTLNQMVGSMQEINASSGKISNIIKVIDEIAFQTNILALNAAVEAARAGEAGMGFAVVADEVRNLAHRSAQAAKDTAGLIEDSIGKSAEGRTKLDAVAKSIRSITESAEKVKTLVDEVNLGSQEQSRGMEQVSKAVAQMQQLTQRTAANAEQSAATSQELSAMSEATRTVVSQLQTMVGGTGEVAIAAGPARKPNRPLTPARRPPDTGEPPAFPL